MRLYGILPSDIESVVTRPVRKDADQHGNPRLTGLGTTGRAIIVVMAEDDLGFVITTFPDD
jgi:hypothetical protein